MNPCDFCPAPEGHSRGVYTAATNYYLFGIVAALLMPLLLEGFGAYHCSNGGQFRICYTFFIRVYCVLNKTNKCRTRI